MANQHRYIRFVDRVTATLGDIQLQLEQLTEQLRACPPGPELIEVAVQLRRLQGRVDELAAQLAGPMASNGGEG